MINQENSSENFPLHEKVYERLSKALMRGEFEPGQKLTLRTLAAKLGTSTTPVRAAISRLSTNGSLVIIPKLHILVKPLTAEKYMEIVDIRKLLEGHAAARASERITAPIIANISTINNNISSYACEGKLAKAMIENQRFHFAIYHCSGSQTLIDAIEYQWLKVGPTIAKYIGEETLQNDYSFGDINEGHIELINALEKHDALGSLEALINIIDRSANYLFDALRRESKLSSSILNKIWT